MSQSGDLQALREAAVYLEGESHDILRATGNDRTSFLHRITSGKVAGIDVGQGGQSLLLDVKGRVLANLTFFVRAKSLRLLVPAGQGAEVVAALARYAIMDDFQVAVAPELASLLALGPRAVAALAAAGVAAPADMLAAARYVHQEVPIAGGGAVWLARDRQFGVEGMCVVAPRAARDALAAALRAAGTPPLSPGLAEVARITALEPAPGKEITPERFPVEIGLGAAIDHSKGCYVGQETIVRMRDRGIVRKRLVRLVLAGSEPASAGDKIAAEGQANAGVITSSVRLAEEPPMALAILANAIGVGATVRVQHGAAELAAEVVAESPPWG
jgi:folate-binding protein YgfZ